MNKKGRHAGTDMAAEAICLEKGTKMKVKQSNSMQLTVHRLGLCMQQLMCHWRRLTGALSVSAGGVAHEA